MKNISMLAALSAALIVSGVVHAQTPVTVTVNGDKIAFAGQQPVQQNGRLLVPLRGVLENIGATVRYSGPTKTIQATKGDTKIELTLGQTNAIVGNNTVVLDVPAQARNGTTLVPLRFVAESLGADVRFDNGTQTVAIRTDGKPNVIVTSPVTPSGTGKPGKQTTFTGVFVDFAGEDDQTYTLKMTDGRTVVLRKNAALVYQNQKIGFDDLRSGDTIVATLNRTGRGIRASVSDDE